MVPSNQRFVQVDVGFTPTKETLKKVRRRCSRESDFDSDEKLQSLCKRLNLRMGGETRRELLYNIEYSAEYWSSEYGATFPDFNIYLLSVPQPQYIFADYALFADFVSSSLILMMPVFFQSSRHV